MNLILSVILCILASLSYSTAYAVGGRDTAPLFLPRIWRRFIAPLALTIPILLIACISRGIGTAWPTLLAPASYILAMFIQKYGGDTLWVKVRGRLYSGLIAGSASLPLAISRGSWRLFIAQVILAISAHLALGIVNPFPEKYKAQLEEFSISLLTVVLVTFMVV